VHAYWYLNLSSDEHNLVLDPYNIKTYSPATQNISDMSPDMLIFARVTMMCWFCISFVYAVRFLNMCSRQAQAHCFPKLGCYTADWYKTFVVAELSSMPTVHVVHMLIKRPFIAIKQETYHNISVIRMDNYPWLALRKGCGMNENPRVCLLLWASQLYILCNSWFLGYQFLFTIW